MLLLVLIVCFINGCRRIREGELVPFAADTLPEAERKEERNEERKGETVPGLQDKALRVFQ